MKKRILIVEDEAISAMALEFTLERMGYEVSGIVDTGEDAVAHAARKKPDLVLMDTALKTEMSGIEAANEIWQSTGIRSIFLSAYDATEIQSEYAGAEPFLNLVKPILDEDLEQVFNQVFDR